MDIKTLINNWLEQVIVSKQTQAEMGAMDIQRQQLDDDFL